MPDECMVNYDLGMMTLVAATIILTTIMLRTMMMTRTLATTKEDGDQDEHGSANERTHK